MTYWQQIVFNVHDIARSRALQDFGVRQPSRKDLVDFKAEIVSNFLPFDSPFLLQILHEEGSFREGISLEDEYVNRAAALEDVIDQAVAQRLGKRYKLVLELTEEACSVRTEW